MGNEEDREVLLSVRDLKTYFPLNSGFLGKKRYVKAVDGVSFDVYKGETFGIVGESGCGKTTLGKTILRLIPNSGGAVTFNGHDFFSLKTDELRRERQNVQIIYQDPASSLDPTKRVGDLIAEPLLIHSIASRSEALDTAAKLLETVNLSAIDVDRYPHEFSGGQRQRISIARGLAMKPKLIVCDEPVSALDVSIQSQILNLLKDLQQQFKLTYIFIAHGLPVVKFMCDRIAVMYLGRIVELADHDKLFASPLHPYTKALISAIPDPDPDKKDTWVPLEGEVPSPANPPKGCHFHTRCPFCMEKCKTETPSLQEVQKGHFVACHKELE